MTALRYCEAVYKPGGCCVVMNWSPGCEHYHRKPDVPSVDLSHYQQ
jgi:hypothetical protein